MSATEKIKFLTDFYMWMVLNNYDHNIRIRVEKKAEMFLEQYDSQINTSKTGNALGLLSVKERYSKIARDLIDKHNIKPFTNPNDCLLQILEAMLELAEYIEKQATEAKTSTERERLIAFNKWAINHNFMDGLFDELIIDEYLKQIYG